LLKLVRFSLRFAGLLIATLSIEGSPITSSDFSSNATMINFDNLTGGNCNACGPSVGSQYSSLGVMFNNPTYPGEDTADTNLTSSFPDASSPNLLFVFQGGHLLDPPAQPFQILFSVPVTSVGFDFGSSTDSYLELDAYGAGHQLLETQLFNGAPAPIGLAGFAGLQESTPIVELDVSYHPYSDTTRTLNFSIDNLEFQGSQVPEPSTIALILAGTLGMRIGRWYQGLRPQRDNESRRHRALGGMRRSCRRSPIRAR
jgi:hypothetical protein